MARRNKKNFSTSGIKVTFVKTEYDSDKNPLFSKVKINFLYKGMNPNGSSISKRTAEKIGSKIAYIPIIGEFIKEKEDFGTHGGKLTITSDDIVYEETTVPYGVVGAVENLWWEEVEDENGKMVEYLTTWGYLWTKRFPDAEIVLNGNNWQSMELDPDSMEGRWIQKKGEEEFYYQIDDALITAFCILGEDIRPAFEDSHLEKFTAMQQAIISEEFKTDFEEMKKDFKDFLFTLDEEVKIDPDNKDNDLEGGADFMLYKLNIENPSSVFSSLNAEEVASKIVMSETDDTVIYFDLEDQKFYTRKFSLNEEEVLEWAEEEAEVIEFGLVPDTTVLEKEIETLETTVTDFELAAEVKDTTIEGLEGNIVTLQESIDSYEALEKENALEVKKEIIEEFREQVSEEDIESIENEIENFSAEEIKSKLAVIVYELSKQLDDDDPEVKFVHKPKGDNNGNAPLWFKEVLKNKKK